jgi:hypothetical protein
MMPDDQMRKPSKLEAKCTAFGARLEHPEAALPIKCDGLLPFIRELDIDHDVLREPLERAP